MAKSNLDYLPAQPEALGREAGLSHDEHQAVRLWLRLLTCSTQIEQVIRGHLRNEFGTTLPRFGDAEPLNTREMLLSRRISAIYKDLPGGQLLGPTFDYTHRLLDFALLAEGEKTMFDVRRELKVGTQCGRCTCSARARRCGGWPKGASPWPLAMIGPARVWSVKRRLPASAPTCNW